MNPMFKLILSSALIIRPSLVIVILSLLTSSASCFSTVPFISLSTPSSLHSTTTALNSSKTPTSTATRTGTMPTDRPFGAWESPISSKSITAGSVRMGNLKVHSDGNLYWMEGRPQEGGRYVLCRYDPTNPSRSDRDGVDVTPTGTNVRTRVHEYGGAAVTWGGPGEAYLSEFATQQLCRLTLHRGDNDDDNNNNSKDSDDSAATNETPLPITPDGNRFRFADGVYDENRKVIFCVREDHEKPEPKDVVNEIVAIDTTTGTMKALVSGYDFCAAPRISPDGKTLVCVVWDHPNMPWDATKLLKLSLADDVIADGTLGDPTVVAGHDNDTSVIQPLFHPITGDLYYISDISGYYNIFKVGSDNHHPVLPMTTDFGGAAPGWALGQQGYDFLADGRLMAQFSRDGTSVLVVVNVTEWDPTSEGAAVQYDEYDLKDGLPAQFGAFVEALDGSKDLYFVGGDASTPASVYQWNLDTKGPAKILACSSTLNFPSSVISVPKQIEFPTTLGSAYGYYYAPSNGDYVCTTEAAPPLLVKAHGGPTACTGTSFNAGIQFWTSRGFAVLDVDYGGSTGYGREYRRRLRKSWGIVDIDDVCNGAEFLVRQGLADGNRLCIDGGSAGGYTTLGALAFRDVFRAGCSLYGVGDLTALAKDTHKFESRYLDGLVGAFPAEEHIYKERSPIESVDTLSCPILLLQGDEDKIVPPNQAESMHAALLKKGIPVCLKVYKGEQHGFRKAENIEDALDSELSFYGKVFGIDIPGAIDLMVDNM